jgi:uncharacterized protein YdeI (YjbR/CyaY-like superfamily)
LRSPKEILEFQDPHSFESWLEAHHSQAAGIWILIAKKGSPRQTLSYAEALDCALCYGWIDGQKAKHDAESWLQYFTRRKKNSIWSQVNKANVERLVLEGRMKESGAAAVEEAKRSGQWDSAYQAISSRELPAELEQALARSRKARLFFEGLDSQNRYAFVFRVATAKKEETRLKRVDEFIRMMEHGEMFYPRKGS